MDKATDPFTEIQRILDEFVRPTIAERDRLREEHSEVERMKLVRQAVANYNFEDSKDEAARGLARAVLRICAKQ